MKHIIVGTAGHVDHGKTMLVKALTGQDTDRLKEEKARGISIELGFAPLSLPSGKRVAIIDVPGHEKFVKNMLAGVGGIDLVMMIIAADEGVMPQTKEHLNIIDLLHIPNGIIVITKADLVDEEWLDLVMEEVREAVKGSVLADAPMVAVSSATKQGLDNLLDLLETAVNAVEPKSQVGPFRMAVDRVFSSTGFGTVVTGTLSSGQVRVGDVVQLLPTGKEVRVRTIQVHGHKEEIAMAGQRVALNLSGIEVEEVARGSVLAKVGAFDGSFRVDAYLELLADAEKNMENRQRIRFHLGTKESLGRVTLLDRDELKPGEGAFVQIVLEEPVVAGRKDRFVIRSYSPMITIGGGEVVDPHPMKHKRFSAEVMQQLETKQRGTPEELLLQHLEKHANQLLTVAEAGETSGADQSTWENTLVNLEEAQLIERIHGDGKVFVVAKNVIETWVQLVQKFLQEYHRQYPLRFGLAKEELRSRYFSQFSNKVFNVLLNYWQTQGLIKVMDQLVAHAEFTPSPEGAVAQKLVDIQGALINGKFQPPSWSELMSSLAVDVEQGEELMQYLLAQGIIVKLDDDMYFHQQVLNEGVQLVKEYLAEHGELQLGQARDILNSSRKYVLPLLEYMDRSRITRRIGDKRVSF